MLECSTKAYVEPFRGSPERYNAASIIRCCSFRLLFDKDTSVFGVFRVGFGLRPTYDSTDLSYRKYDVVNERK